MLRKLVVTALLSVTASLGVAVAPAVAVPQGPPGTQSVWYRYAWYKTDLMCDYTGLKKISIGASRAYYCVWEQEGANIGHPWGLYLLD
jgi:hypothetical protein